MTAESIRLVQLYHPGPGRKVAMVREPWLVLLNGIGSVYELALTALDAKREIEPLILSLLSGDTLAYTDIYEGKQGWRLLPSFDHPENPYACLVSGTGLTHKNSALNRQAMHAEEKKDLFTDSMRMYQWGMENGHPAPGQVGAQPEWFYKGTANILVAHGGNLEVPLYAGDGGEEPEIAGAYIIDGHGTPVRIGLTTGNEFSDHVLEKKNYLYLAPSKLRQCAIGPEIVINAGFNDIHGEVSVERGGDIVWSENIRTGESNMSHSLANIEHHHFKHSAHTIPYQAHIHFFGADAFSFGKNIALQDNDIMKIYWEGFGRPLKNYLIKKTGNERFVTVKTV